LGARVEAIESRPTDQVLSTLETLQGGSEGWRQIFAAVYATSPEILYGAGLAARPDETKWTFRMPDGVVVERTLAAEAVRDLNGWPRGMTGSRWLSPEAPEAEGETWRALVSDEAMLPLSLRDSGLGFRRFRPGNSCILAVQMRGIVDIGSIKIADFLRETENEMRADPPCALILDLRFNSGGNYANSYAFARSLPELIAPGGYVYVLTSAQTFSAAITTTAFVKQAMGSRALILGEPVGDRLTFWAEGGQGCLPNAGFCFNYATGKHDYSQACTDWTACFWLNWLYPVRVDSLAPDQTIAMSFADYRAGRDPVFDRAAALATSRIP
jgi:hypothetical protein